MTARTRLSIALTALVVLLILAVVVRERQADRAPGPFWTVEVDMSASAGTFAQLFWAAAANFVEEQSLKVAIQPDNEARTLRFRVPSGVHSLRFNPIDAAGTVTISRMALRAADGRTLVRFSGNDLVAPHQVESITRNAAGAVLVTGGDPWVIVSIGCMDGVSEGRYWRFTGASLALASAATVALLVACAWVIGADVLRRIEASPDPAAIRRSLVWLPTVFLLVLSAKLVVIQQFQVTSPFWDQWDGEALAVYVPYYSCGLSWPQMFALHNEHRIVFSRLLALGLLVLNGQWDPRLQQVVNAAIHAAVAVLLFVVLWRALDWRRPELLAALVVVTFALPHSAENTLAGFQVAFYFFVLFSLLGLWLTTAFRAGTVPWILGWICAGCGLFAAAGGVLLPAVIGLIAVLEFVADRRQWRRTLGAFAAGGVVLAVGVLAASPPLAHHQMLKAASADVFFGAFLRNLAWPWIDAPGVGVLMWLPTIALLAGVARRRGQTTVAERFVIGLAAWVMLQSAAIAYGRGGASLVPAGRYQDFLSLGFVANTVALLFVLRTEAGLIRRPMAAAALVTWIVAAALGLDALTNDMLNTLNWWRPRWEAQARNVRRFVRTGDVAELESHTGFDIPYPVVDGLIDVLQRPIVRRILPAAVRAPLTIEPRINDGAFIPNGTYPTTPQDKESRGWGSFTAQGNPAEGDFESMPTSGCAAGGTLSVPVAGFLTYGRLSFGVKDLVSGRVTPISPDRLARESWVNVIVPCPLNRFVFVAADHRPDFWFAFREPVETGWASNRAEALIAAAVRLLAVALLLTMAALKLS